MLAGTSLKVSLTAIADPELLQSRAEILGLDVRVKTVTANDIDEPAPPGTLHVLPVSLKTSVQPGRLDPGNATYVLDTLDQAIDGCLAQRFDAMVTGPVSKSVINDAGIAFSGHTEYLAGKCAAPLPVMMLANDAVRVALVTTHLPLDAVAAAITGERLEQVLTILHHDLVNRFAIKTPRIAVCGLNPHAGEDGHLGKQEKTVLQPVIDRLRLSGLQVSDPMPADTVFTPDVRKHYDVIVGMYHDQGLPALKALGFGETVNITLGLPIIRTSVDHGTALALAGSGQASPSSLRAAIHVAMHMVQRACQPLRPAGTAKPRTTS